MIAKLSTIFLASTALVVIACINPQAIFAEGATGATENGTKVVSNASDPLEKALAEFEEQRTVIELLKKRRNSLQDLPRTVIERRLEETTLLWLEQGNDYAAQVIKLKEDAVNYSFHHQQAKKILKEQADVVSSTINGLQSRTKKPVSELSATQLASEYIDLLSTQDSVNRAYEIYFENIELAKKIGIDTSRVESSYKESIGDLALSRSILLEIEMQKVKALRETVAVSPDDKEVKTKLTISTKHLKQLADHFTPVLALMDSLAIDTAGYREQILSSTGSITTDAAEIDVIKDLLVGWGENLWGYVIEDGPDLIFKIILFLFILYIANKISKVLKKITEKALEKSHLQFSELLRRMVVALVRNIILIIGFLIGFSQIGISLGPLLAGFGIVGFVVGFALQDSLANFAAGLMILIYRPYDVGDLIESGGMTGRVSHMSFVNTTIITFDNQTIVVPNNKIWSDVIKNITAQTTRRVDMVFGISYSDDISKAEQILQQILDTHDKVLTEPEPIVRLHELGESSVNFIVRPWVNKEDYWDVYWDITRSVKIAFDQEGISIPFPQRDVHLFQNVAQVKQNL